MHKMNEVGVVLGRMYKHWNYVILTVIVAFVFVALNGFILNFKNLLAFNYLSLFDYLLFVFMTSVGFFGQVYWFTYLGTIFLGILIGILVSLLFFRFSSVDKNSLKGAGFFGALGVFLGAAAPGCSACGVGLLSFLGLSSLLSLLPFHGNEVLFLAVGFTGYSVYSISGKLYDPVCEISLASKNSAGRLEKRNNSSRVQESEKGRKSSKSTHFVNTQIFERRKRK